MAGYYSVFADSWSLAGGFVYKSTVQGAYGMPWQTDTADDATGQNDGTWVGTAAYVDGEYGRAFSMGGSQMIDLTDRTDTVDSGVLFVRARPTVTGVRYSSVGLFRGSFSLFFHDDGDFRYNWSANSGEWSWDPGVGYTVGSWQSAALRVLPDRAEIYVDGVLEATNARYHPPVNLTGRSHQIGYDAHTNRYFKGEASELIWLDTVDPADLVDLSNGPTPLPVSADTLSANGTILSWTGFLADSFGNGFVTTVRDIYKDDVLVASNVAGSSYDVAAHGNGDYKVRTKPSNDSGSDPIIFADSNAVGVGAPAALAPVILPSVKRCRWAVARARLGV